MSSWVCNGKSPHRSLTANAQYVLKNISTEAQIEYFKRVCGMLIALK